MQMKIPHNLEAEQALIGCMFLDQEAAILATETVGAQEFYDKRNQIIFQGLWELVKKGIAVDMIILSQKLEEQDNMIKIGGLRYLSQLATAVGNSAHVRNYINVVKENAARRQYIERAGKIVALAVSGAYEELEKEADSIKDCSAGNDGDMSCIVDVVGDILQKAISRQKDGRIEPGGCTGLQTGFIDLDAYTGGLQPNNLIVLAARPSMGKSALAMDIAMGGAKSMQRKGERKNIAVFSLEMTKEQITTRICSATLKINNDRFKLLQFDEMDIEKMLRNIDGLEKDCVNIYIDDTPGISTRNVYAKCHALQARSGNAIGLIIIDYLQLMSGDKSAGNREQEVAGISREMKNIAKKFNCPVLLLAQLNRNCEQRADKRPMLSDLRESGAIEQDADIVMLLHREEYYFPESEKKGEAELILAKHRDGAVGTIRLSFVNHLTTFRNLERGRR